MIISLIPIVQTIPEPTKTKILSKLERAEVKYQAMACGATRQEQKFI